MYRKSLYTLNKLTLDLAKIQTISTKNLDLVKGGGGKKKTKSFKTAEETRERFKVEQNNATAFQFPRIHCASFFLKGTCSDAHRRSLKLFHDAVIFFSMTRHVTAHATRCNIVAGR